MRNKAYQLLLSSLLLTSIFCFAYVNISYSQQEIFNQEMIETASGAINVEIELVKNLVDRLVTLCSAAS